MIETTGAKTKQKQIETIIKLNSLKKYIICLLNFNLFSIKITFFVNKRDENEACKNTCFHLQEILFTTKLLNLA